MPSRYSPEELISMTIARTFPGARRPRSRSGTLITFVPISTAGSLELEWETIFLSLLFLTRFCTFSLNDDSILPYTEVGSDFQSEALTVFTVTSTNSMNKLVTHWTLVSAWWLLTNHTLNLFGVFLLYCFFWSVISVIFIFTFSILLVGLLSSLSRPLFIPELKLFQFFFSFYWTVHVFSERRIPKSDPLRRSKHSHIRACLDAWMQSSVFLALDKPKSFRPGFRVVVGHPSNQHISKILVGSFNWSSTLRMSWLPMHELHSWTHTSQVLYYFVRKFAAIIVLQYEWRTERTKDVH